MAKSVVVIKVSPGKGKGGSIIARQVAALKKNGPRSGKPIYQTKAQLNVHIAGKNGERRK